MARDFGIASISGCAIANVGKRSAVSKANMWSTSGQQRQSSLFRSLSVAGERSFTQGKNSASFRVDGEGSRVYFPFTFNAINTNYQFVFDISGLRAAGWYCALSSSALFENDVVNATAISTFQGSVSFVVNSGNFSTRTIYIGIWNRSAERNRDTAIVTNLLVNIV